ncbi:MAG: diguanylate cyclase [Pyrinomonadaceae bacterium]
MSEPDISGEEKTQTAPPAPRDAHVRRPALVFMRGEQLAAPIPLERDEVTLGRALEADVRVNDARASRLHARIRTLRDKVTGTITYSVADLGSTNGTLLNGEPVSESALRDGDKLTIGEHLIRFELLDDIDREYQRQIHRLLAHDELTGLLTSKSFFSELRREAARAEADGRAFCVLMMDLDHFKLVNDTYGHLVGSQTLEEVGHLITRALRVGDVAARFGGEEFAAFLLDADCEQALVAAERVRRAIGSHAFAQTRRGSPAAASGVVGDGTFYITISVGVAAFPDDARDPIELIELADTALYHAKHQGRNRVSAFCYAQGAADEERRTLPPRRAQSIIKPE